jgi:hypothetical protein
MVGSAFFTDRNCLLKELDSALKHVCRIQLSALVKSSTFPTNNSYVETKYKLSGLEVAHTSPSTEVPFTGNLQQVPTHVNLVICFFGLRRSGSLLMDT